MSIISGSVKVALETTGWILRGYYKSVLGFNGLGFCFVSIRSRRNSEDVAFPGWRYRDSIHFDRINYWAFLRKCLTKTAYKCKLDLLTGLRL